MGAVAIIALSDELWSGIAVVAAPGVEKAHGVDHADYTLWVFAVPLLLSALLEAPIALVSDRIPRRHVLAASLGALAVSLVICASADRAWLLSLGLALAGAASGVSCAVAEAELVSANPGRADRAMSRWMAFGAAGDVLAPLAVAAALWLGGSHRGALAAATVLMAVQGLLFWHAGPRFSRVVDEDEKTTAIPLFTALAQAAREPRLWMFLFATAACTLLDEIVVALAVLRLHDDIGWSETFAAAAMTGYSLGSFSGAVTSERLLERFTPRALLVVSTLTCLAALALFICASSPFVAAVALVLLGASASPQYPLCLAAAYDLVPGKPGLVNALGQAFVWLDVVAPLVLGAIASRYGISVALAALSVQPLVVLTVVLLARRADQRRSGA